MKQSVNTIKFNNISVTMKQNLKFFIALEANGYIQQT